MYCAAAGALDDLDEQEKVAAESGTAKQVAEHKPSAAAAAPKPVFGPEPPPAMGPGVAGEGMPVDLDDTMNEFMVRLFCMLGHCVLTAVARCRRKNSRTGI